MFKARLIANFKSATDYFRSRTVYITESVNLSDSEPVPLISFAQTIGTTPGT